MSANEGSAETETLSIRVPKALKAQIEQLAQATGQDQSKLAERAISDYVAFEAEQLAKIHRGIADADAGRFASAEEVEAVFNRYRAYRAEQAG